MKRLILSVMVLLAIGLWLFFFLGSRIGEKQAPHWIDVEELDSRIDEASDEWRIEALVINGPLNELDIEMNGCSIFEPIVSGPKTSQKEVMNAVFDFVCTHFYTWNSAPGLDVRALLYGTGYGLCGEESTVMCALWEHLGVESQTISWPRHVAAEACVDDQWFLFDAQHRIHFSLYNDHPTSYLDVVEGGASIPDGIDPVGYQGSYLNHIFFEESPQTASVLDQLVIPAFCLSESQTLTIKPRRIGDSVHLPISKYPETMSRSDLLPTYNVTISQAPLRDGESARFFTGLPVIAVDLSAAETCAFKSSADESFQEMDVSTLASKCLGETNGFWLKPPVGCGTKITYALADWIGDRIFELSSGKEWHLSPEAHAAIYLVPKFHGTNVRINQMNFEEPLIMGETCCVALHVSWQGMPEKEKRTYQFVLEELSSELNLEVWRSIGAQTWTYEPTEMETEGEAVVAFEWAVPRDASPYRPLACRTVLARVVGPELVAGENWLKMNVYARENR